MTQPKSFKERLDEYEIELRKAWKNDTFITRKGFNQINLLKLKQVYFEGVGKV